MRCSSFFFLASFLYSYLTYSQVTFEREFENIDFNVPTEIQFLGTENERVFVVEQLGLIKVFPKVSDVAASEVTTFLDISDNVLFSNGQEVGLLGLAFHPQFEDNGFFYVYYTTSSPVDDVNVRIVLSRFQIDENDPNKANPDSELVLFRVDKNQQTSNHNGGKIAFGPDGYLYMSIGDGGGSNDPNGNSQNINNVFGSICRIDVDLDGSNPIESNGQVPDGLYEIPSDNPFVGSAVEGEDEIFVYGIRNTWKFSFDEPTGRLWGADVGQLAFEEINLIENGKNYGWNRFEGDQVSNEGTIINDPVEFPVHSYGRDEGDVSITGGYVYHGSEISSLSPNILGEYIFGDAVSGRVWVLNYDPLTNKGTKTLLFKTDGQFVSSFGEDNAGELYFSDYGANVGIYKLVGGTTEPSGVTVEGIGNWEALGNGIIGVVSAVATSNSEGKVYYGGNFTEAGSITANNIAVWDKNSGWASLGSGANGSVNSIVVAANDDVYVGGDFTTIGGINANYIAKWDGNSWSSLEQGLEGPVAVMVMDNQGNLYAGGSFESLQNNEARNIAVWNTNEWNILADSNTGIAGLNNEVRSLAIGPEGTLYVGGNFDEAGGNTANRIATWNNTTWGTLGSGTSGFVEAIAVNENSVFLGGNFILAGQLIVNRIVEWDITQENWSTLGEGVNNNVMKILLDNDHLYAGGSFRLASNDDQNTIVNNVAQFNLSTREWKPLGMNSTVGVDILVNDMDFEFNNTDAIYVGGNFNASGSINARSASLWKSNTVLDIDEIVIKDFVLPYPNPTVSKIILQQEIEWSLFDVQGKFLEKGMGNEILMENYIQGIYLLTFKNIKEVYRIVKE